MRYLSLLLIGLALAGCGNAGKDALGTQPAGFIGARLPSPDELANLAPPRATSGSNSPLVRTLRSDGAEYVPWPGWSANAEISGLDAVIHGGTDSLNYVMFQLGSINVTSTGTLTELMLEYDWVSEPAQPEGLYIGFADHSRDRWVWVDGAEAHGQVLDIEMLGIHGVEPPETSFIAVVNYSGSDVNLHNIWLRFKTTDTVTGDERLYYSGRPPTPSAPAILRISPVGGSPETIVWSGTDVENGVPLVINYEGEWKLNFARSGTFPPQMWRCDIDGSNEVLLHASAPANAMGHVYGTDRGLFLRATGPVFELWAYSAADGEGRLSRDIDHINSACIDLAADPSFQFAAIAGQRVDPENGFAALVSLQGNPPFPIEATPTSLYTRLPDEDVRAPDMLELASLAGDPRYYIYFCARNRDDATFNIYRLRYPESYEPEPVVVDSNYEIRWLAVSPNGKWLAYLRQPAGAVYWDMGEIVVTSLLDPDASPQVIVDEALYNISWYDPTP